MRALYNCIMREEDFFFFPTDYHKNEVAGNLHSLDSPEIICAAGAGKGQGKGALIPGKGRVTSCGWL